MNVAILLVILDLYYQCFVAFLFNANIRYNDKTLYVIQQKSNSSLEIETRIQQDAIRIRNICTTYAGRVNPWLPKKSQINVMNYYLDLGKKLGWCLNPKVRSCYGSYKHVSCNIV